MKITIIGGGPAGYTAALESAKKGFETILVEKDKLGGVCLNYGCIPTKSILASCNLIAQIKHSKDLAVDAECSFKYPELIKRTEKLVKKIREDLEFLISSKKILVKYGEAKILNKNTILINNEEIKTDIIILATGSKQKDIGIKGINPEEVFIDDSEINSEEEINILGAGITGCELANIFSLLDFRVNLFEKELRILPFMDEDAGKLIHNNLIKQGVKIRTNYIAERDKEFIICCGREANIPESEITFKLDKSFIKVDENFRTNIDNIYAVGDVNGHLLLAYWAMAEGKRVIDIISNNPNYLEFESCPNVIFTNPELSFFGKVKRDYKNAISYFKINSKSIIDSAPDGFIKLFVDENNLLKAGIIVGKNSSEMITQLSFFYNKNIDELKTKLFFHPTFSESINKVLEKLQ